MILAQNIKKKKEKKTFLSNRGRLPYEICVVNFILSKRQKCSQKPLKVKFDFLGLES